MDFDLKSNSFSKNRTDLYIVLGVVKDIKSGKLKMEKSTLTASGSKMYIGYLDIDGTTKKIKLTVFDSVDPEYSYIKMIFNGFLVRSIKNIGLVDIIKKSILNEK